MNINEITQMPIIVEQNIFLYPFMISPLILSDPKAIAAADYALENNLPVIVATAKDEGFFDAGVIGTIMRKTSLPQGRVKVLFQGQARGKIFNFEDGNFILGTVGEIATEEYDQNRIEALLKTVIENARTLAESGALFPNEILNTIDEKDDPDRVIDLVSSLIRLKKPEAYELFIETNMEKRAMRLIELIMVQIENHKLQHEIKGKVRSKIDKINREYFLKEQLRQIQNELGEDTQREEEIEEYKRRLEEKREFMPEDGFKEAKKQLGRLSRMHPDSADASLLQTYIEFVLEIPFGVMSKSKLSVDSVSKRLEKDHYSLTKPKMRIVEFFAVKQLLADREINETGGTILCFVGPPGVGKTSLANSIAKALKKELVRVALGGMEDVNELRGHRRTYVGAMPGRIVQGLINAKSMDPVVVLDEIDKVGRNMRGDPTAALLEILDPEQNDHFRDYYLNFAIDLSKVIFIATANDLSTIPAPLRDRLEIIHVSSYTPQEKIEIAKQYLIPQEMKKHALSKDDISITPTALKELVEKYTREAGVRNLRRTIATIMRKGAKEVLEGKSKISITVQNLKDYLEKTVYEIDPADKKDVVGVVNGLAWTSVGGDLLKIEAIKVRGKGALQLTGSLGEVMKESAQIAFSVVKTLIDSKKLPIDIKTIPLSSEEIEKKFKPEAMEIYNRHNLHLHAPEGATPKDGPSAGIAMATVIASILSGRAIRSDVAMTGELTLTGKVLTIGGLKEKLIAAHRAKIKTVLIPTKNYERDLDEIPDEVKKSLEIIAVDKIEDVLKVALTK